MHCLVYPTSTLSKLPVRLGSHLESWEDLWGKTLTCPCLTKNFLLAFNGEGEGGATSWLICGTLTSLECQTPKSVTSVMLLVQAL